MRPGAVSVYAYARKSNRRNVAEDEKSTTLQYERAVAFATENHWPKPRRYADDAISGTMTKRLAARERLIADMLADTAPRRILIIRDRSRFSRRAGEHSFAELKRLAKAGVEIWYYSSGRQFKYGNMGDNIVGYVEGEQSNEYVRQIAEWTKAALVKKFKAGHVVGGAIYGYDNKRLTVDGVPAHVVRVENAAQAAVVRRIFERAAVGAGVDRIVRELNADGIPTPGRSPKWARGTVASIVRRPIYYGGPVTYGRHRMKDDDGEYKWITRPSSEWITAPSLAPALVSPALWQAAAAHRAIRTAKRDAKSGRRGGRLLDGDSLYLLTNFARCGKCGGSMTAMPGKRVGQGTTYGCTNYQRRNGVPCTNGSRVPVAVVERALLEAVRAQTGADVAARILGYVLEEHADRQRRPATTQLRAELERAERKRDRAADYLLEHDKSPAITARYQAAEAEVARLAAELRAAEGYAAPVKPLPSRQALERMIARELATLETTLAGERPVAREMLRNVLDGVPLTFWPAPPVEKLRARGRWSDRPRRDTRALRFEGKLSLLPLFSGLAASMPHVAAMSTASVDAWYIAVSGIAA